VLPKISEVASSAMTFWNEEKAVDLPIVDAEPQRFPVEFETCARFPAFPTTAMSIRKVKN